MVTAPATLDFATAIASVAALDQSLRAGMGKAAGAAADGPVALDLSTLTRFDSSALAVLLELRRRFGGTPARFTPVNPPPKLLELAEVYGVAALLFGVTAVANAATAATAVTPAAARQ